MPDASSPARHRDAVIFACDAAHLPYAWVAARQIARLETGRRFDIVIASPDTAQVPPDLMDGPVRWVRLDTAAIPPIRHPNPRITLGTFYRHLLPGLLGDEYGRLLYMDTDTWLRRPGLQGLFDRAAAHAPDGDWAVAAALVFLHVPALATRASARNRALSRDMVADLGGSKGRLFQSGVMLMRTAQHVAAGIERRVLDFASQRQDLLDKHGLGDQAAMNGAIADEVVTLDPRWNWHLGRWRRGGMISRFDPYILHFAGPEKPWLLTDDPDITDVNPVWFSELRRWNPDFRPQALRGTLPWRRSHPRFGIGPLDAAHRALRSARLAVKYATPRRAGVAAMAQLIDEAEIG